MKTTIKKQGTTVVISIEGKLSHESQIPLKDQLAKLSSTKRTDETPKQIIFDLKGLEFVGSSGISSFVQTLKDFNARVETKPRYCHVKSEFQKIIRAFDTDQEFEFFESMERASRSQMDH